MSDKLSLRLRSRLGDRDVSRAIAVEMQEIVQRAAQPISPGESIGAQMNKAWRSLGRPSFWRVREAWYAGAGCWSAQAVEDFRARARRSRAERAAKDQEHEKAAGNELHELRDRVGRLEALLTASAHGAGARASLDRCAGGAGD